MSKGRQLRTHGLCGSSLCLAKVDSQRHRRLRSFSVARLRAASSSTTSPGRKPLLKHRMPLPSSRKAVQVSPSTEAHSSCPAWVRPQASGTKRGTVVARDTPVLDLHTYVPGSVVERGDQPHQPERSLHKHGNTHSQVVTLHQYILQCSECSAVKGANTRTLGPGGTNGARTQSNRA